MENAAAPGQVAGARDDQPAPAPGTSETTPPETGQGTPSDDEARRGGTGPVSEPDDPREAEQREGSDPA